jgi:hypothetical protein
MAEADRKKGWNEFTGTIVSGGQSDRICKSQIHSGNRADIDHFP